MQTPYRRLWDVITCPCQQWVPVNQPNQSDSFKCLCSSGCLTMTTSADQTHFHRPLLRSRSHSGRVHGCGGGWGYIIIDSIQTSVEWIQSSARYIISLWECRTFTLLLLSALGTLANGVPFLHLYSLTHLMMAELNIFCEPSGSFYSWGNGWVHTGNTIDQDLYRNMVPFGNN